MKKTTKKNIRLLEVCCTSLNCAIAAQDGKADRIELCERLDIGGLTPSIKLFQEVKAICTLPIFTLIRCRPGDFQFTESEISLMIEQIHQMKYLGAKGIVIGALTSKNQINELATQRFVEAANPLPLTFHKAFDKLQDFSEGIVKLRDLGVSRLLTSGGLPKASDNPKKIMNLAKNAGQQPLLLACGGIRSSNVESLANIAEIKEFHSAANKGGPGVNSREVRLLKKAILTDS